MTPFNACLVALIGMTVALGANGQQPARPTSIAASAPSAAQQNLAAELRHRLLQSPGFIREVARFHGTSEIRFAGEEPGRQRTKIDEFLAAKRLAIAVPSNADGSSTIDEFFRRESVALHALQTQPTFLASVARSQGMTPSDFVALSVDLQIAQVRAHMRSQAGTK